MQKETFYESVKVFSELYKTDDILVTWGEDSTLKLNSQIGSQIKHLNLSTEEFADVCFKIISIATNIATGKIDVTSSKNEDVHIVNKILLQDTDLLQLININTTSNLQILEEGGYELLTKRLKINIHQPYTYTIAFTLNTHNHRKENKQNLSIELSKKDAKDLIELLNRALVDIEELEAHNE